MSKLAYKGNKKKTIILLCIWLLLLLIIPSLTLKIEDDFKNSNLSYISSEFEIEEYNVTLDVDKDNKVDVTEIITINIPTDEYNGIYKSIPLWEEYYNKDLQKTKKKVVVTNLRVIGEKFTLENFNDKIGIKIGSTKTNVEKGLHTYTIKYRYDMGKDSNSDFDEFVFNLFENYDNTKINSMSVTVNMPKEFENNLMFLKGKENITDEVNYEIKDNTINIYIDNYLLDNSLTMNIILPNNYFVGGNYNYGFINLIICLMIIIISTSSIIAWKKYDTKSLKRIETVELYAPDDLDPAQIGYIYGENDIKKLTVSLIISLASKKYISIEEISKNKYKINKINSKNKKNISITEQLVYQELFKNGNSNILSEDNSFVSVFDKISICLQNVIDKKINDKETKKIMNIISSLLIVSIVLWMFAYLFIKDLDPKFNILYLVSFIAIFITGFISIFMNQKTNYGQVISAKILGFRNYLITAEKEQLDSMVNKNPDYFYDILPYTYVLNVSDKWISTFDKHNVPNLDIDALNNYENNLFMMMSE